MINKVLFEVTDKKKEMLGAKGKCKNDIECVEDKSDKCEVKVRRS